MYVDDAGSHHICIDLSSVSGGNFCDVTGQSDWCSSSMTCQTDGDDDNGNDDNTCEVQNWCVCQWAFASYILAAGGCDYIQDIVCEAVNMKAVEAYTASASNYKYELALECLQQKCGFSTRYLGGRSNNGFLLVGTIFTVLAVGGILYYKTKKVISTDKSYFEMGGVEAKQEKASAVVIT